MLKDPVTCVPEIRWEDATPRLRMLRRCYCPYFAARAVWNIAIWLVRGAPIEPALAGMTRWEIACTAWRCHMAMYHVGVKRQYLTIREAMDSLDSATADR